MSPIGRGRRCAVAVARRAGRRPPCRTVRAVVPVASVHVVRPRRPSRERASPAGRRAGPAGAGPLARARRRAGRRRAGHGRRADRAAKPATQVETAAADRRHGPRTGPEYVSRGGHKLAGALEAFADLGVEGRRCLDAGASPAASPTCCCAPAPRRCVAVDVGYGQLAWSLRTDDRGDRHGPHQRPRADAGADRRRAASTWSSADLSFISLRPGAARAGPRCAAPDADWC